MKPLHLCAPIVLDPRVEPPISFTEATHLKWLRSHRAGKRVDVRTVHRWASHGVGGIRLEFLKLPAGRFTSEAALVRFFHRLQNPTHLDPAIHSERARDMAIAASKLEAAGI